LVNDGTYNSFFGTISGQTRVSNDNTIPIVFATNSAERARIDASGRLLVGRTTNNAGEALQIDANGVGSTVYSALIGNSSTSTAVYNVLRFTQGASGSATGMIGTGGSAVGNAAFQSTFVVGTQTSNALVFATNDTERARITSGGDFTIGATSTSYRLACTVAAGADRDMFICGVSGVTNGLQVNYINSGTALSVKFNSITTTASAANAFLDSADSNRIYRSTSSLRYKKDVEDLDNLFADSILNLRPVWYRSKADLDNKDWSWYGLIAEEVAEVEPRLVHWTYSEDAFDVETVDGVIKKTVKEGAERIPDGVQYERLSVLLLDIVKRQNARLEKLEAEVSALKGVH